MSQLLFKVKNNYSFTLVLFIVLISFILYFVDKKKLEQSGDILEAKISKVLAIIYFLGSIALYIVIQFIL